MEAPEGAAAQPDRAGELPPRRPALGRKREGSLAYVGLATTLRNPEQSVLGGLGPAKHQRAMAPAAAYLMNRRMRGPHVRWCGRGRGNPAPYPIEPLIQIASWFSWLSYWASAITASR